MSWNSGNMASAQSRSSTPAGCAAADDFLGHRKLLRGWFRPKRCHKGALSEPRWKGLLGQRVLRALANDFGQFVSVGQLQRLQRRGHRVARVTVCSRWPPERTCSASAFARTARLCRGSSPDRPSSALSLPDAVIELRRRLVVPNARQLAQRVAELFGRHARTSGPRKT